MTGNTTRPPQAQASEEAQMEYIVEHLLGKSINTCAIVKIEAVTPPANPLEHGYVDVKPMVTQLSASDKTIDHNIIHNIPYFRYQAGGCAVIIDPVVGDIGLCVFAQNDISGVKSSKKEAPPTTYRKFDWSDGIYLGGILNAKPTTYIQLIGGEINIVAPTKITITTPELSIIGTVKANGRVIDDSHKHTGVQTGGGQTGTVV